jgi:autotransporter-associated beta strand protein
MAGVYGYADGGSGDYPSLSDANLNTRDIAHGSNVRGINIEGAHVRWGDGTTDRFFLPATPSNSYINIHAHGSLAFDYDGPVTLDTPISGGRYHASLSTPAYGDVSLSPTRGNAVTFATPQNYHGTTTVGAGATLLLGTGAAGGDGALLTGTPSDAIVDDGALVVRDTATALSLSNITGAGSLTQSGAATTTLTGTTSYTGATTVTAGTLALAAGSAGVGASSGVRLTGGTLDLTASGGTTVAALAAGPGGTLALAPRAGAAALTVTGALSLGGGLVLRPSGAVAAARELTLIHATGPGATGTFAGLPEGAKVTVGGAVFHISYRGGGGHDVVLLAGDATPAASAASAGSTPGATLVLPATAGAARSTHLTSLALLAFALTATVIAAAFLALRLRRRRR